MIEGRASDDSCRSVSDAMNLSLGDFSELIGLIPEDALLDAARFYLRLHGMKDEQILERRLRERAGA